MEQGFYNGPALRRLRRREGLNQAAMAQRLGLSPSYLNLIERNQRPITARVLMALLSEFRFDPRTLRADEAIGGVDGLSRRLADPRFADLGIDRDEMAAFLSDTPHIAAAFARLYDTEAGAGVEGEDALGQSRREIERWRNHYADLDTTAELIADELRLSRGDPATAIGDRLREKHHLSVRVLPAEVLPGTIRRLDLHARQVQLSELLPLHGRNFQLAVQLSLLEQRDAVAALAAPLRAKDARAADYFERHLHAYFAAALLMPYRRFLRACQATGYDLPVLERRFGVSFEQLAHRLTTLQRVGERGLPFFMARIDRAGQFSKRFAGASGATFLEPGVSCPLWNIHRAFAEAGSLCLETISVDGATPEVWFTAARAVDPGISLGEARFVVVLGLEARLAGELAQARGHALSASEATPTGPGCRRCRRVGCKQRSLPPVGVTLQQDPFQRLAEPFPIAAAIDPR